MERIGPYRVLGELGRGGAGVVLRARHERSGREVALKLLLSASEHQRRRFAREVGALVRLAHPNLVPVLDVGEERGRPYLVMELVAGESLDRRLLRGGRLDPPDAVRIAARLAVALDYVHGCGLVHRDVKPANVLIDREGRPRLTDFGLVRDLDPGVSKLSHTGVFLGTPSYWPPEQALGKLDEIGPTSDVFSFGATLYHMLTGQPPGPSDTAEAVAAADTKRRAPPPSKLAPEVDPTLDAIVLRCLAPDPAARFRSASALSEALAQWQDRVVAPRTSGRTTLIATLAAVVGVAAAGFALVTAPGSSPSPRPDSPLPASSQVARDPSLPESTIQPGLLQAKEAFRALRAGDGLQAERQAREALALDERSALALAVLGGVLHSRREGEEGLVLVARALELEPDLATAWWLRGVLYVGLNQPQQALSDFLRSEALEPNQPEVLSDIGFVLTQLGRAPEALPFLDRALALAPDQVQFLFNRVSAREQAGDLEGASDDCRRVLGVEAGHRDALFHLARLENARGRVEEALGAYRQVLTRDPDDEEARVNLAVVLLLSNRLDEAERELSRALQTAPNSALAHYNLGQVALVRRRIPLALEHTERAMALDPTIPNGLLTRGQLRLDARDVQGALEDLDLVVSRAPGSFDARKSRANARFEARDFAGAIEDASAALAQREDRNLLMTRCASQGILGRHEGALADAERCVALAPTDPKALSNRANVRSGMGDVEGARRDLIRVLELEPGNLEVQQQLESLDQER